MTKRKAKLSKYKINKFYPIIEANEAECLIRTDMINRYESASRTAV